MTNNGAGEVDVSNGDTTEDKIILWLFVIAMIVLLIIGLSFIFFARYLLPV